MKKIICPSCSTLIEVDEKVEEDKVCPTCGIKFPVIEGEKALARSYKLLKKKGFSAYTHLKFEKSNEYYEEALKINPNDFDILTKYILNLCYLNTYLEDNYDKIIPLFEEHEIVLNSTNTYLFLAFLKDFVQNVSVYFNELDIRLMKDGSFINEKYVLPFLNVLNHLKDDFAYFDEVVSMVKQEEKALYIEDNPNFVERYNKYKNKVLENLTKTHNLINKGDFIFENGEVKYLNTNIKNGEISEASEETIIVPNKEFKKEIRNLYIVGGVSILLALILLIIGFSLENEIVKYCAIIPAAVLIIYLIIFVRKINKE